MGPQHAKSLEKAKAPEGALRPMTEAIGGVVTRIISLRDTLFNLLLIGLLEGPALGFLSRFLSKSAGAFISPDLPGHFTLV